ncbi:MAG: hypothetical protein ABSF10_12450 [Verrucomicrobiota bacterium]|jgi:hypothetical protein
MAHEIYNLEPTGLFSHGTLILTLLYFSTNTYEIFAYADPAPCFALGAQANVGGAFLKAGVSQQTDLHAAFGFGNQHKDHSGEFNSDNMSRWQFWDSLLFTDFGFTR